MTSARPAGRPPTRFGRWSRGAAAHLGIASLLAAGLLPAGLAAARADWPEAPSTVDSLVAAAHASAATDADRAALLAAEAYRLHPSARTHAALLSVLDTTAPLTAEVVLADDVTAMASASHTDEVLAATTGGDILRWDLTGDPEPLGSVDGWVTELVSSTAASAVAALDADGTVHLIVDGRTSTAATSALDTAVSPTGRHLAVLIDDDDGRRLEIRAVGSGTTVAELDLDAGTYDARTYDSVDLTDDHVVLSTQDSMQGEHGGWERLSLPGLEPTRHGSALPDSAFDAHLVAVPAVSQGGELAVTVHPLLTTVVNTADGTRAAVPTDGLPVTLDLRTVVFSPDAGKYFVVRDHTGYVLEVRSGGYWKLQGALAADAAAFADENRVVTAHGRVLTLWDVGTPMPRTQTHRTELAALDRQVLSPDRRYLLAAGDEPDQDGLNLAVTYDLDATPGVPDELAAPQLPARVTAFALRHDADDTWLPVVTDDGRALLVEATDGSVREAVASATPAELSADYADLPADEVEEAYAPPVRYETGLRNVLRARISAAGDLVLAAADGSVRVVDPDGGRLRGAAKVAGGPWTSAEIAPDGRRVAFSTGATVAVADTTSGETAVQLLGFADTTDSTTAVLAFGREELLVAHPDGVVVLEADGSAVRATADFPAPAGIRSVAVLPGTGLAVLAGQYAPAVLVDVATGEHVGALDTTTDSPTLAATPGRLLVIGSSADNRRVVRRDTSADGLLETACATAGRDLTVQEWRQAADTAPPSDLSCTRAP